MASIPNGSGHLAQTITNGSASTVLPEYDVIIVGAGFSGISALHRMRKAGLKVHIFEGGSDFGGVWYWNRYPGARVDSETPFYQLNIPEVYKTWSFSQRFPDHVELRRYMAHVDKTLGLRKDVTFDAKVNSSTWDAESARWTVTTENGLAARAQFLILCTGLLHKAHMPEWPGRETYKGVVTHTGAWLEHLDVKGKKVAIIGSGATSVQVVQEIAKEVSQLTVLLRRPSFCLPMGQRTCTEEEQIHWKAYYPTLFAAGRKSIGGFPASGRPERVQDVTVEEREAWHEELWRAGAFNYLSQNFSNVMTDTDANEAMYDFWKRKVRQRLTHPAKQQLMAPDAKPYYFGTKRTPLENGYYDALDQDNVDVVDIGTHPIEGFTERGLRLGGGAGARDFDVVVCATGFDAFTGSLVNMGLKSKSGVDVSEVWSDGVKTYLGVMIHGFPNAFMVYSPQAPTALANGPTIIECQADFIHDIIVSLRKQNLQTIEAQVEAQEKWKADLNEMITYTLFQHTDSWWNTSNVPGKKAENQNYVLGIATYEATCRGTIDGWKGFDVAGPSSSSSSKAGAEAEWNKGIEVSGPQRVAVSS